MGSSVVAKTVAKQLKYYFDVGRLEDGFDLRHRETSAFCRPRHTARPTLNYEGLHDRALKHYFSQPEVRALLTKLEPDSSESEEHSPRERQIRKSLKKTMKKYQFGKSQIPEWFYIYTLGGPRSQQSPLDARATSAKPRKGKALKAGWPVVRQAPGPDVPPDEEERLISNASKIITHTTDWQLVERSSPRMVRDHPLSVKKPRGEGKPRPLTAKYSWDTQGHRLPSAKLKAYDDSHLDKAPSRRAYLRRPQSSPRRTQQTAGGESESAASTPRPRQGSLVSSASEQAEEEGETAEGQAGEYQVRVKTGNCIGASTSAAVYLTLFGNAGRSPPLHLQTSQHNKVKFQRGKEDEFVLKTPYVGQLKKVKIGHDRPELSYAWYLDWLTISDVKAGQQYHFPCQRWLSGQDEDRNTHCTFVVSQASDSEKSDARPSSGTKATNRTADSSSGRPAAQNKEPSTNRRQASAKQPLANSGSQGRWAQSARPRPQRKVSDARGQDVAPSQAAGKGKSPKTSQPSQDKRGKNQKPQPVDQDFLAGYKAGLEAVEEAERQKREEDRLKHQQLLAGPSIHDACEQGDLPRISTLLSNFPEMLQSTDENGLQPVHVAASSGQVEVIRRLTATGCEQLDVETPTGYTPVHLAAMNGHSKAVKILNAMGASMDCTTVDQQTPLHLAAAAGQLECVKVLVASGVGVLGEDSSGRSALALAQQNGQQECVDFLQRCQQDLADPESTFALMQQAQQSGGSSRAGQASAKQSSKGPQQQPERSQGARPMTSSQRKKEKEKKELEEKREQYEEQHRHMQQEGVSFLDLIRQEMEGDA